MAGDRVRQERASEVSFLIVTLVDAALTRLVLEPPSDARVTQTDGHGQRTLAIAFDLPTQAAPFSDGSMHGLRENAESMWGRVKTRAGVLALALMAAGCGGSEDEQPRGAEFEPLFTTVSSKVTAGSIYGIWAGHLDGPGGSADFRYAFAPDTVTTANRCHFTADNFTVTVGIKVAARVTDSDVTILESKEDVFNDGTHRCNVNAQPGTTAYTIDGDQMASGDFVLVKVSD